MFTQEEILRVQNRYGIRFIKTQCKPFEAEDKSLPRDSYLITSIDDNGSPWYDIVQGLRSSIFDAYHDTFPYCITKMVWTEGTTNPKTWQPNKK